MYAVVVIDRNIKQAHPVALENVSYTVSRYTLLFIVYCFHCRGVNSGRFTKFEFTLFIKNWEYFVSGSNYTFGGIKTPVRQLCPFRNSPTEDIRTEHEAREKTYVCTLRCLCVTIVAVEKRYVLHNLSVCLQPQLSSMPSACALLLCYLWPVWLHHISPHYLINATISEKKILNTSCILFSLRILSEIFLILSTIQRNIVINVKTSLYKVPVFLATF